MRTILLAALLSLGWHASAAAQVFPEPAADDPRLQVVSYDPIQAVHLVLVPDASLTVLLLPGDRVQNITLSDTSAFQVEVAGDSDALNMTALRSNAAAILRVATSGRQYEFVLQAGQGTAPTRLVRFEDRSVLRLPSGQSVTLVGTYRVTGDREVRPATIADDGERTYITWDGDQYLSAVFAIGPTGDEEVVDGYMRDGIFTIDRVYQELVFRIDDDRARARRQAAQGQTARGRR